MPASRSLAALVLLAFLSIASLAQAVGPLDGVYALTVTAEGTPPYVMYLVVIQNESAVGIAFLDPFYPDYHYGFGALDPEQRLQGTLSYGTGLLAGSFNLRFLGATVEGSGILYDDAFAFTGPKVF